MMTGFVTVTVARTVPSPIRGPSPWHGAPFSLPWSCQSTRPSRSTPLMSPVVVEQGASWTWWCDSTVQTSDERHSQISSRRKLFFMNQRTTWCMKMKELVTNIKFTARPRLSGRSKSFPNFPCLVLPQFDCLFKTCLRFKAYFDVELYI